MKTHTSTIVLSTLAVVLCGCRSANEKSQPFRPVPGIVAYGPLTEPPKARPGAPQIVKQPPSLIAVAGSSVKLDVQANNTGGTPDQLLRYQWSKDGKPLAGATSDTLWFTNIQQADIGMYVCKVSNGKEEAETYPMAMSVASMSTSTNGQVLGIGTPIDYFTGSSQCCNRSFDRWNQFNFFDGPNVTNPDPNFPNPLQRPKLTVDTLDSRNVSVDTCVLIMLNSYPYSSYCNDDWTPPPLPNTRLSQRTVSLGTKKKYRVGIGFVGSTVGSQTHIWWNYMYHP